MKPNPLFASSNQINEKGKEMYVQLSPNPSNSIATVRISNAIGKVSIVLTDLSGKQLWQSITKSNKADIDVSHFAAGAYMVIVKDEKEMKTVKLIKD